MEAPKAVERASAVAPEVVERLLIDPVHSSIGFSVRHMAISNVRGRFARFSGAISYNRLEVDRSSVAVTIETASVDTTDSERDTDLRSTKFLDAARFPKVVFRSKHIEQQCDGYTCIGDLTLHGVTKEIAIPFEITGRQKDLQGKQRIGFEGGLKVDRREFGLTYNAFLANGGLVVGNEVKVELSVEAVRE